MLYYLPEEEKLQGMQNSICSVSPTFMGRNMDLRVLDYFLMVAREENFTRAANRLHIAQSTLSRQIVAPKEEISTKLFLKMM